MKNPDHARFAEWDAAYVLGALSPAERREFEDHLDECEKCPAAVTDLSALPGLLGRIDDARAFALLEGIDADIEPGPPVDLMARIQSRERRDRIRRSIAMGTAIAAAAAIATVLTLMLPPALSPSVQPTLAAELTPTDVTVPLAANISLTSVAWGTRIDMDCTYRPGAPGPDGGYAPVEYALWISTATATKARCRPGQRHRTAR